MLTQFLASAPPTPGDHLENLVLLCLGILVLVLALAVCDFLFDKFHRAFKADADRAKSGAARRKLRGRCLKKRRPEVRVAHLGVVASDEPRAREALARHAGQTSARMNHDLRLVSRRERSQEKPYARQR